VRMAPTGAEAENKRSRVRIWTRESFWDNRVVVRPSAVGPSEAGERAKIGSDVNSSTN
jgi:hypothetical protein